MSNGEHTISTLSGSVLPDSLTNSVNNSSSSSYGYIAIAIGLLVLGYLGILKEMWNKMAEMIGGKTTQKQVHFQEPVEQQQGPLVQQEQQTQQQQGQMYGQQYRESVRQAMSDDDPLDNTLRAQYHEPQDAIKPYTDGSDVGYCYVGDDYNGDRKCATIHQSQQGLCGSNQIYPTSTMCVNPNLK